uniref:RING-type domain-containing protein n=1 Tax=Pinguiococcus pyrenoidosus TaxID=172671 RepID=A0A7R9UBC3_9STRA|mmetsp:Transcript_4225/g.16488  ORF Transcript_4225/g.16488 Transcript_4225/m.16488 type:complete len:378 (+) Transcript_4225:27-1160(+)
MGNQVTGLQPTRSRSACGSGVPEALSEWPQLLDAVEALNAGFPLLRVDVTAAVYLDRNKVQIRAKAPTPTQSLSQVLAECQWASLMPVSLRKPPLYTMLKFKGASAVELLQCSNSTQIVSCGAERCAVLLNPQQFLILLQLVRNITCTLAAGSQMGFGSLAARRKKQEEAAEPKDSECSICLDAQVDVALPCGHGYCRRCIADWTSRSFRQALSSRQSFDGEVTLLNCPSCRAELCTDADFVRDEGFDHDGRPLSLSRICSHDAAASLEELEEEAAQRAEKELWHFATWEQTDLLDFVEEARARFFVLSRMALENNFEAAALAAKRMCVVTRSPPMYDKHRMDGKERLARQHLSGGKRPPPKLPARVHRSVSAENKV